MKPKVTDYFPLGENLGKKGFNRAERRFSGNLGIA
jgi:hypothetical protein